MSSSINTDDLDFMYTALLNCNLFRLTKHLCDTTIMSDFRGFAGHSAILSAGSEYLKSLIQTTVPSQPCVLDLRHFSSDLVQCLVEYIYTGEVVVPDCRGDTHGYVTFLDICGTDVTKKTKYKIESRESFEKYWNLIYENNNKRNFNEYANNINLGNNILHNINLNNTWDALSKHISSNHHVETSDVEKLHHARNIFTKLKEYRNSNTLTETTLICGDWRYNCHGVVICAVSRYVNKAVLMRGGLFNMDISHFPSFSVESILTYFYTGQFDCSGKSLEDYGGVFMALVDLETGIENRSRLDVKMYEGLDGHEDTEGGGKGFMNISMAGLKESMENASMGGEGNASQTNGWNEDESLKSHQREHLDEDIRNKDQGASLKCGLEGLEDGRRKLKLPNVFRCQMCMELLASQEALQCHVASLHMFEKPHLCSFCGRGFEYKSQYQSHIRMHTGERPYKCLECSKSFQGKLNLFQHSKVHSGEKPYECEVCSHRFTQKSHLTTHLRKHTGERPFCCLHCPKRYKNRLDLRIHCFKIHAVNIKSRNPVKNR